MTHGSMPATSAEPINSRLGLVMKSGISGKNTRGYKPTLPTLRSGNSKLVIICNNCPPPSTSSSSSAHLLSPALLSPHSLQTARSLAQRPLLPPCLPQPLRKFEIEYYAMPSAAHCPSASATHSASQNRPCPQETRSCPQETWSCGRKLPDNGI